MKILKTLSVASLVLAITACDKNNEFDSMNGDAYSQEMMNVSLKALPAGVEEGSVQDFVARAGEKVNFDYDQYSLSMDSKMTIQRQALWLKMFPEVAITVEGHCDERGTRKYNFALGERRSNAVKRYLVASGISSSRIDTVSYGKEKPAVAGHNKASWAENRRAVSVLVK